jgi:hypothetical protein
MSGVQESSRRIKHMDEGDLRDEIARLEDAIEESGRAVERCRKIILASKAAIVIGGALMLAMMLGLTTFDPMAMIGAIAAMVGGTVMFGSNKSTLQQTVTAMQAAEAHRAELIGKIDLRVVGNGAWKATHGVSRLE